MKMKVPNTGYFRAYICCLGTFVTKLPPSNLAITQKCSSIYALREDYILLIEGPSWKLVRHTLRYRIMVPLRLHDFAHHDDYWIHDDPYFITKFDPWWLLHLWWFLLHHKSEPMMILITSQIWSHDDYWIRDYSYFITKFYPWWLLHPWWFLIHCNFVYRDDYYITPFIR